MDNIRTFKWYCLHHIFSGKVYERDINEVYANADGPKVHIETWTQVGVVDEVVTLKNFKPLFDQYVKWWEEVDKDWNVYEVEKKKGNSLFLSLHWMTGDLVSDPGIDLEVLEYVYRTGRCIPKMCDNPSLPEHIVRELIEVSGTKKDPTGGTKGGEVVCFLLHNKQLPGHLVDLSVRKMRKATNQKDSINHPNITDDTLRYLVNEGKSESVKKNALRELMKRGSLKV